MPTVDLEDLSEPWTGVFFSGLIVKNLLCRGLPFDTTMQNLDARMDDAPRDGRFRGLDGGYEVCLERGSKFTVSRAVCSSVVEGPTSGGASRFFGSRDGDHKDEKKRG